LAVVDGYRQSVLGTTGRRVFSLGQGTLDGIAEATPGTLRGTAIATGDPYTISDPAATFPPNLASIPVAIASGTGAGRSGIIIASTDTSLSLLRPLETDQTSVYQIGGIAWTWKSGWRRLADDEASNPRDLEWAWKPTRSDSSFNAQVYYDHSPQPAEYSRELNWNSDGISVLPGSSNLTLDLSVPRGYNIHRLAGHRDPYGFGHRYLAVQLQGVQGPEPHRMFSLTMNGAE
jgi:hypothetical protein